MLLIAAVLGLLAALCTAISHPWFRREQFDKTAATRSFQDRFRRALHWRAEVGLEHDFRHLRRWAGIGCACIFGVCFTWALLGSHAAPIPPPLAIAGVWLFLIWCSLDFWIDPQRTVRQLFRPMLIWPTVAPWLALGLNRLLLGTWSVEPFVALFRLPPWAHVFIDSSPLQLAAIASAFYLISALVLVLLYSVLFSLLPLTYLALVGPPTWSARRWVAMPEDHKHHLMLALDFFGRLVLAPLAALCVVMRLVM